MAYQFPSLSKIGKLPCIDIAEPDTIETYRSWFGDVWKKAGNIPLVPPVWQDFTIRFTLNFARRIDYIEIVHYSDDFTVMQCCHCIDGKKAMEITLDYNDLTCDDLPLRCYAPDTTTHSHDWLENEAFAVLRTVLSVQYFLLMHRPEVVPVLLEPSGRKNPPAAPTQGKPRRSLSPPSGSTSACPPRISRPSSAPIVPSHGLSEVTTGASAPATASRKPFTSAPTPPLTLAESGNS